MIRHIGLVLLALFSAGSGVWQAVRRYRRALLTVGLAAFADVLRDGVTRLALPQEQIFRGFSHKALDEAGFTTLLLEETVKKPGGALYRAANAFFARQEVGYEVKETFLSFAKTFGTMGMGEQAKACEVLSHSLNDLAAKEKQGLWSGIRLTVTVGCTAGLAVLILFW